MLARLLLLRRAQRLVSIALAGSSPAPRTPALAAITARGGERRQQRAPARRSSSMLIAREPSRETPPRAPLPGRPSRLTAASSFANGSTAIRLPSSLPGAGDAAVDEERVHRLRRLDAEDTGAVLLRKDLRAAGMDEQRRVPGREEADRGRRLGVGQRQPRQVDELAARLVAKARAARARPSAADDRLDRQARPVGDLRRRRRPEAAQVAADELARRLGRASSSGSGADPVLGEREQVGPAALPGPRRRHADEVEPDAHPVRPRRAEAGDLLHLLARQRLAALEPRPHPLRRGGELRRRWLAAAVADERLAPRARGSPRSTSTSRAARRGGSSPAAASPGRPCGARAPGSGSSRSSALHPGEQADVHRRRVLRLDPADPLERLRQRAGERLEQALAGEQRPVQLALAEDALGGGHGADLAAPPSAGDGDAVAADREEAEEPDQPDAPQHRGPDVVAGRVRRRTAPGRRRPSSRTG